MQLLTNPCTTRGYLGKPCLSIVEYSNDDSVLIDFGLSQLISEHLKSEMDLVITALNIVLTDKIEWHSSSMLTLVSKQHITFAPLAQVNTSGTLELKSGFENPDGVGTVSFEGEDVQIFADSAKRIVVQYNPTKGTKRHKYQNPSPYYQHISSLDVIDAYMLVNNVQDLQDIRYMLRFDFALSQDIMGPLPDGKRFQPIKAQLKHRERTFSGTLEGNQHAIKNIAISFPDIDNVSLFSRCDGRDLMSVKISNLIFDNVTVVGKVRAAVICAHAQYVEISNVTVRDCSVSGENVVGGVVGAAVLSKFENILVENTILSSQGPAKGAIAGAAMENEFAACNASDKDVPLIGQDVETNRINQCED